jgi:hypothetical protein
MDFDELYRLAAAGLATDADAAAACSADVKLWPCHIEREAVQDAHSDVAECIRVLLMFGMDIDVSDALDDLRGCRAETQHSSDGVMAYRRVVDSYRERAMALESLLQQWASSRKA